MALAINYELLSVGWSSADPGRCHFESFAFPRWWIKTWSTAWEWKNVIWLSFKYDNYLISQPHKNSWLLMVAFLQKERRSRTFEICAVSLFWKQIRSEILLIVSGSRTIRWWGTKKWAKHKLLFPRFAIERLCKKICAFDIILSRNGRGSGNVCAFPYLVFIKWVR